MERIIHDIIVSFNSIVQKLDLLVFTGATFDSIEGMYRMNS